MTFTIMYNSGNLGVIIVVLLWFGLVTFTSEEVYTSGAELHELKIESTILESVETYLKKTDIT